MLNHHVSWINEAVLGHGAQCLSEGGVRFRLWAPGQRQMQLAIEGQSGLLAMRPLAEGWHELSHPNLTAGARYQFVLPDGLRVPDPASRFQSC